MNAYVKTYDIRWADLDPNAHVRHTAYMDYAAQTRVAFLTEHGFGLKELHAHAVGPILFRENVSYLREVHGGDRIAVSVEALGESANRKHFRMRHHVHRGDGVHCVTIEIQGAWMDLRERKVIPAPPALAKVLDGMPRAADWAEIVSPKG